MLALVGRALASSCLQPPHRDRAKAAEASEPGRPRPLLLAGPVQAAPVPKFQDHRLGV